jgi:hypothetical protein
MGAWLVGACGLEGGSPRCSANLEWAGGLGSFGGNPCARIGAYAQASADINRSFVVARTTAWVVVVAPAAAPVGVSAPGRVNNLRRVSKAAVDAAGADLGHLDLRGPHDLRHTFTTGLRTLPSPPGSSTS